MQLNKKGDHMKIAGNVLFLLLGFSTVHSMEQKLTLNDSTKQEKIQAHLKSLEQLNIQYQEILANTPHNKTPVKMALILQRSLAHQAINVLKNTQTISPVYFQELSQNAYKELADYQQLLKTFKETDLIAKCSERMPILIDYIKNYNSLITNLATAYAAKGTITDEVLKQYKYTREGLVSFIKVINNPKLSSAEFEKYRTTTLCHIAEFSQIVNKYSSAPTIQA